MRILVTGAGGFVGSLLAPRLLAEGHDVLGLSRDPERVRSPAPLVRGDALTGEGLDAALDGVEVAYYLIHSMERAARESAPFQDRDRRAAESFAAAATRAGVRRIVYLGGLHGSSHRSRHLCSRWEVERILLAAVPDSIALRASIVIGARSRSFRLLVHLVERMRVLALPAWRKYRTQPIDERDVTDMLLACASAPVGGRSLDIGGPDVLTYGEMIERIAELMLVSRPALGLGVSATPFTARVAAAIAGEDPELVLPLMESLDGDLLPADDDAAELLGVELHSFDAAVEHALREWERTERLAAR
ncbi:MAG TPA: NAD(P)H-binding protein [Solirubrobacteraceae bacterium]